MHAQQQVQVIRHHHNAAHLHHRIMLTNLAHLLVQHTAPQRRQLHMRRLGATACRTRTARQSPKQPLPTIHNQRHHIDARTIIVVPRRSTMPVMLHLARCEPPLFCLFACHTSFLFSFAKVLFFPQKHSRKALFCAKTRVKTRKSNPKHNFS